LAITLTRGLKTQIKVKFAIGATFLNVHAHDKETGEELVTNGISINLTGVEPPKKAGTVVAASEVIFVIDRSGSMDSKDVQPKSTSPNYNTFSGNLNRLGTVLDGVCTFIQRQTVAHRYSLISFDSNAKTLFEGHERSQYPQMLKQMLSLQPSGGTDFTNALTEVQNCLSRRGTGAQSAKVFFLSDGEASSPKQKVLDIKRQYPGISIWTIRFSQDSGGDAVLQEIAAYGGGKFVLALDAVQLEAALELFGIQELGLKS